MFFLLALPTDSRIHLVAKIFELLFHPELRKPDLPPARVSLKLVLSIGIGIWGLILIVMLILDRYHPSVSLLGTDAMYVPLAAIGLGFAGLGWVKFRGWY